MRRKVNFNKGWFFLRSDQGAMITMAQGTAVELPHTWNAEDGQDGGNDYYRGRCWYAKKFPAPDFGEGEEVWLQFDGVAMSACVYLNGRLLGHHEGGYSAFRLNITDDLLPENLLAVSVDNSKNDTIYPQKADFTFYGGIYRNVYLITVPSAHIALGYYGGPGIKVKSESAGQDALVTVEAWVEGQAECADITVDGQTVNAKVENGRAFAAVRIKNVHLWNGVYDPYLYTAKVVLDSGDMAETRFGCRTIAFDADQGFILNGKPYPLCGAARHQDRQGMGNALTIAEHDEDMAIMREMGVNTIRLAHYQHDQYFYDLCDQYGMVVWAEIPYITQHMPGGKENTLSQMRELIVQNYNHPSIICWGLSNEITAAGGISEDLIENHKLLNDLCHRLDATRPTTMAHAFMLKMEHPFVMLSDIRSYNLYYGWYLGELEQNDEWFDKFHAEHPDAVIGLSEYGADGNPSYQAEIPEKGDWSETYQAVYHEHMLKMWSERPYIWAMHCWNMFDFGADGRDEGGKPGQNQKGLVTFDRRIKKDAFYIYKAYLSKEPFVHICGRRYQDRAVEKTEIKVYSNLPEVTLIVDNEVFATVKGDKIFKFEVPLSGEHTITAKSGEWSDKITIRRTDKPNPDYFTEGNQVVNWFDKPEEVIRDGCYSIMDSIADLKKHPAAAAVVERLMALTRAGYGEVARNVEIPEDIQRQMDAEPLHKILKRAGGKIGPDMISQLNSELNKIRKK